MLNVSSKKAGLATRQDRVVGVLANFISSPRAAWYVPLDFLAIVFFNAAFRLIFHSGNRPLAAAIIQTVVNTVLLLIFTAHNVVTIRRRQWRAAFSVFWGIILFLLAQGIAYAVVKGLTNGATNDSGSFTMVSHQFDLMLLSAVLSLGAVYGYLRIFKISLPTIGLRRPRWSDPLYAIAMVLPYFITLGAVLLLCQKFIPGLDLNQEQQLGFDSVSGAGQLLLVFISLAILPPIIEEILVRGLIYSSFKKALPKVLAVIATSLLFAAAHLPEGGAAGPLYVAAIDTFLLSLFLIWLRELTGGLYASIVLHSIKNSVAFFVLFGPQLRLLL